MDVELETKRLRLRRRMEADIPAFIAGLNDWEVLRYLTVVPYPYAIEDAREWIDRQTPPKPRNAHFAIELPGAGMIGVVSLDDHLGYWLARAQDGRGFMTEACIGLLDWHFAALPDDVVDSSAHVGNEASLNVQRKLGFTETGKRSMRFVRSQNRDVEHVETVLMRPAFEAAKLKLKGG
jgi:RimJ/RimL family protein N-acetyltransferase